MNENQKKYVDLEGLSHFKALADNKYVAKESGKGLSTNDYTTAEKTKLAGINEGAEANVIENVTVNGQTATITGKTASVTIDTGTIDSISVNGAAQTIDANKNVDITVPTNISDLNNDSNFVSDSNYTHTDNNYTTADKNKLAGIDTSALANKIEKIKVNNTEQTITDKTVNISVPVSSSDLSDGSDLAKKTDIPEKTSDLTNDSGFITGISSSDVTTALGFTPYNSTNPSGYQTASDVEDAINTKVSSTYKAKGSVAFASLPSLTKANEGNVYNITDSFTTTADFVEGVGKTYPAGTNVVIVNTSGSTYKYDVLAGFVDLSGYVQSSDLVAITNDEIDALFA